MIMMTSDDEVRCKVGGKTWDDVLRLDGGDANAVHGLAEILNHLGG